MKKQFWMYTTAAVLSLFSCVCLPAHAGHMIGPIYSGTGNSDSNSGSFVNWGNEPQHQAVGTVRDGYGPGQAYCIGYIVADWEWVPDYDDNGFPDNPYTGKGPGHYIAHCNGYGHITMNEPSFFGTWSTYNLAVLGEQYSGLTYTSMDNHQIKDYPVYFVDIKDENVPEDLAFLGRITGSFDVEVGQSQYDRNILNTAWYDWDTTASVSFYAELQWVPDSQNF